MVLFLDKMFGNGNDWLKCETGLSIDFTDCSSVQVWNKLLEWLIIYLSILWPLAAFSLTSNR